MIEKRPRGWFIVGTDTGIGKTHVGSLLAARWRAEGRRIGVYKPAESGWSPDNETESDAFRLWNAAGKPLSLNQVCPQRFHTPVAPYLAAEREQRTLDSELLRTGLAPWLTGFDAVLVEGAGGLFSPLTRDCLVADLAVEFGFPLVIVAPDRLGVIHQVMATLEAARSYAPTLRVAGIVLSQPRPVDGIETEAHLEWLGNRFPELLLGCVKHEQTSLDDEWPNRLWS